VQEVEVHAIQPQALLAHIERAKGVVVALVAVPQLGRHEDLLSRDAALSNRRSDIGLVAVHRRRIDVAIAERERLSHRCARLVSAPRPKDAQPYRGHLDPIGERNGLRRRAACRHQKRKRKARSPPSTVAARDANPNTL